jgi:hypothetical protein
MLFECAKYACGRHREYQEIESYVLNLSYLGRQDMFKISKVSKIQVFLSKKGQSPTSSKNICYHRKGTWGGRHVSREREGLSLLLYT